MAISPAIREYYAQRIFAQTTREQAPPNFRPLQEPHTGRFTVEGCRGGGKNILEVRLVVRGERVADLRASCGLCNPAMMVAADIVLDWARGRGLDEILAVDPLDAEQLAPLFDALGGTGRPDDAREKFQYAVLGVQNAVRDHRGLDAAAQPAIAEPIEGNPDADDDVE